MEFDIDVKKRSGEFAPLVLAYIGDAVYEVYVRTRVIAEHPDMPAHMLHRESIKYVSAKAQAASVRAMEELLSEKELAVYKRGRNAKSHTVPKNAGLSEYRHATGFEALAGWLYLSGENERLERIMCLAYECARGENTAERH